MLHVSKVKLISQCTGDFRTVLSRHLVSSTTFDSLTGRQAETTSSEGNLISLLLTDSSSVISNLFGLLDIFLSSVLSCLMLLYLGSHYDAVFTLTITVYVFFYMTIPYLYKKKIYQKNKVNREAQSLALNWLASLVNGWEVIRISKEPSTAFFNKKSEVAWSGVSGATIASSVVYGSLNSLQQFFHYVVLVTLCLIAVTYSGGHSSLKEEVLAFILYIDRYRAVASTAGSTPKIWSDFRLSMDRLSAIFGRQKNNIKYYPTPSAVGLELKNLVVGLNGRCLVSAMNVAVDKNMTLVVSGKNGRGKTTLLKTILGLCPPLEGDVRWSTTIESEGGIAYIPQKIHIFVGTLYENISLGRDVSKEDVVKVLQTLGWTGPINLDEYYTSDDGPSGGERKRIGVARALFAQPRAVVIDELEAGVDAPWALIQALKDSIGLVIAVSHTPHVWNPDRVMVLENGSLI